VHDRLHRGKGVSGGEQLLRLVGVHDQLHRARQLRISESLRHGGVHGQLHRHEQLQRLRRLRVVLRVRCHLCRGRGLSESAGFRHVPDEL
jgi:hypothetical protein